MSDVLKYLGVGSKNAIKRSDLAIKCGLSDRKMRKEIEYLQHQGYRIVNMSDSNGYYVSETEQEEERRLLYVSMTRARKYLYFSYVEHMENGYKKMSPFYKKIKFLKKVN